VEEAVAAQWNREVFPPELVAALREQLTAQLRDYNATAEQEHRRMTERVATIRRERFKWAEKAMEGAVPDDIARERQQLLADQLLAAESALARLSLDQEGHEATLHAVLDLVGSCGRAYELSEPKGRRNYNQAFFTGIFLDVEQDEPRPKVATVRRTPVLAALQEHRELEGLTAAVDQEQQRRQDQSLDGVDYVSVSNNELLVELVRLYSNPLGSVRLARLRNDALSKRRSHVDTVHTPQRVEQRLGHELISQIVGEYVSGTSSIQLAARYGIGKATVLRLLRDCGVVVRRRGVHNET
jgi:hypothetical protein